MRDPMRLVRCIPHWLTVEREAAIAPHGNRLPFMVEPLSRQHALLHTEIGTMMKAFARSPEARVLSNADDPPVEARHAPYGAGGGSVPGNLSGRCDRADRINLR
jgi:hypothetical protein